MTRSGLLGCADQVTGMFVIARSHGKSGPTLQILFLRRSMDPTATDEAWSRRSHGDGAALVSPCHLLNITAMIQSRPGEADLAATSRLGNAGPRRPTSLNCQQRSSLDTTLQQAMRRTSLLLMKIFTSVYHRRPPSPYDILFPEMCPSRPSTHLRRGFPSRCEHFLERDRFA